MAPHTHLERRTFPTLALALILALAPLLLTACGSSDDDPAPVVQTNVDAAAGGTFASADGAFRITIPAGALDMDAALTVSVVPNPPPVARAARVAASRAFAVSLGGATLSEPATVELRADRAPVHPELGEVAELSGEWERLSANFYRASDSTVVALTDDLPATLRVIFRDLQLETGAGVAPGLEVFLNETFGNEAFFGGTLGLHTLLQGVRPVDAVALGVQVDLSKVPAGIVAVMTDDTPEGIVTKNAALADPATTLALIQAGAVIGVKGVYEDSTDPDLLTGAGITCALCHVTVTPTAFDLGGESPTLLPIGMPNYDGVPNVQMDAGAILALTPFAQGAGQATVDLLNGWGPSRFDVRALPDNPLDDGVDNPTDTPPIWNFVDLEEQGYRFGWDGLFQGQDAAASQAEAVYDLVMHANGAFGTETGTLPPALSVTPPQALLDALAQAETDQPGNDVTAQKLLDLQSWMRSIASPAPVGFDEAMAEDGFALFNGKALCNTCHTTADLTGPGLFTFTLPAEAGDLAGGIHVPSLRGISSTAPYLHDGSIGTLPEVVTTLNGILEAGLTAGERAALVEYLKSL